MLKSDTIINTLYNEYIDVCKRYFLREGIKLYKTTISNTNETINADQKILINQNANHKKDLERMPQIQNELKKVDKLILHLQNEISLIDKDLNSIDKNESIENEIKSNKEKRNKYEKCIEDNEKMITQIKNTIKELNKYETLQNKISAQQIEIFKIENTLLQFAKYRQSIKDNEPIEDNIHKLKNELREFEEVMVFVEKAYNDENNNLVKYNTMIEQIKKDIEYGRLMEEQLLIVETYRNVLKQLPFILLGKIQTILEKKVNDLLTMITDFTLKFDIADGKIDIYLDRSIYVDKTRCIIINNASGFERFIASLAIRLALLDISNLPKINFMAIDEGWSSFDTHNLNNIGIILDYLTHKFDFILTISHLTQIKEHCDIQISLRKDDKGFSKIIY